jgi:hypothetical protein
MSQEKLRRRWYQFTLRRMFLTTAVAAMTLGYWNWFWRNYQPGYFDFGPALRAVFVCCCGFGISAGVLFDRLLIGVAVTVLCVVAAFFWIS